MKKLNQLLLNVRIITVLQVGCCCCHCSSYQRFLLKISSFFFIWLVDLLQTKNAQIIEENWGGNDIAGLYKLQLPLLASDKPEQLFACFNLHIRTEFLKQNSKWVFRTQFSSSSSFSFLFKCQTNYKTQTHLLDHHLWNDHWYLIEIRGFILLKRWWWGWASTPSIPVCQALVQSMYTIDINLWEEAKIRTNFWGRNFFR